MASAAYRHSSLLSVMALAVVLLASSGLRGAAAQGQQPDDIDRHRQTAFDLLDTDQDGLVSRAEFRSFKSSLDPAPTPDQIRALFNIYDLNKDNSLNIDEIVHSDVEPVLEQVAQLANHLDLNKNGKVSFREFRDFVMAHHRPTDGKPFPSNPYIRSYFDSVDEDGDRRITPEELVSYFESIDSNGNGRVNHKEFRGYLSTQLPRGYAVPPANETQPLFDMLDKNNDGTLDLAEIVLPNTSDPPVPVEADITNRKQAFKLIDQNGDGRVDVDEYMAFFGIGEKNAKRSVELLDADNSGDLNVNELIPRELRTPKP